MFVNSIIGNSLSQHATVKNSPKFQAKPSVTLENKYKVLVSQDIWADKLKVKMPESEEEKTALIEVLQHRLKLDRFVRLNNQKANLAYTLEYLNSLLASDPSNPEIPQLRAEINKKGNLTSVFNTLDKNIEREKKKNQPSFDYFTEIADKSDEYVTNHILTIGKMDKFWQQIVKNNINADESLSTKQILDIVTEDIAKPVDAPKTNHRQTKDELLASLEKQYKQILREITDIYADNANHYKDALKARTILLERNKEAINKFPGIENQFKKFYRIVERTLLTQNDILLGVDVHPLGEVWKIMNKTLNDYRKAIVEANALKLKLNENPNNQELKNTLTQKEAQIAEYKEDWIEGLKYSVKFELENRVFFDKAGKLEAYKFFADEHPIINKHRELLKVYAENNNSLPDEVWADIVSDKV